MTNYSRHLKLCLTCMLASMSGYQLGCAGPADGETAEIGDGGDAKAAQTLEVYRWVLGERDKPDFGMPLH